MIFLDTSAVLALVNKNDKFHQQAKEIFSSILEDNLSLVTHNYIVIETLAVAQQRVGLSMAEKVEEVFNEAETIWIDSDYHKKSLNLWKKKSNPNLSFADCSSFTVMDSEGIEKVFTFDKDFKKEGFEVL